MRKRLVTLGMAGLMTAMSVVPAFAATEGLTANDGDNKVAFDALTDEQNSDEGTDYWKGISTTDENSQISFGEDPVTLDKSTEVGVQQAMSYTVTIPSFISLNGTKDAAGGNKAEYYVAVEGDIAGSSVITVLPNLTSAIAAQDEHTDTKVADAGYTDFALTGDTNNGTGSFPLFEQGGVKKDLKATITFNDVDWAMETDKTTEANAPERLKAKPTSLDDTTHKGEISVANLSAGIFKNTINFDVTYTNSAKVTP